MITICISLTWVDPHSRPNLTTGIHRIAEVMPHVLDCNGLSLEQEPNSVPPANATAATDLFDLTISCLESALAG